MPSDHIFTAADGSTDDREQLLKLHDERVEITRAARELGVVRATIETTTREQLVSEDLAVERVEITHVPIGRPVEACPPIRIEGDTTILSVVEEVLVVTRQLVLKEEVHMKKVRSTATSTETVTLREQHAVIAREPSA